MAARQPDRPGRPARLTPMRPLPRVLAVTDSAIVAADDFPIRAAAIAAAGPAIGIVVRLPGASSADQLRAVDRVHALTRPPEAATIAHGDPGLARIGGAHGVQLRARDLAPRDARQVLGDGWVGLSVHSVEQARAARDEGVDYLVAGAIFETQSHPGQSGRGLEWLAEVVAVGVPVFAIGGVTAERLPALRDAGAWGVAAIGALWHTADSAKAADQLVRIWSDEP